MRKVSYKNPPSLVHRRLGQRSVTQHEPRWRPDDATGDLGRVHAGFCASTQPTWLCSVPAAGPEIETIQTDLPDERRTSKERSILSYKNPPSLIHRRLGQRSVTQHEPRWRPDDATGDLGRAHAGFCASTQPTWLRSVPVDGPEIETIQTDLPDERHTSKERSILSYKNPPSLVHRRLGQRSVTQHEPRWRPDDATGDLGRLHAGFCASTQPTWLRSVPAAGF